MTALSGRDRIAAAMSEAELQSKITSGTRREPGMCKQLGLTWYHTRDSRGSDQGWPDLVIGGGRSGRVIFRELKREGKDPTPAQRAWLGILTAAGLDAGVWRPSDLLSGRVARELAALAHGPKTCGTPDRPAAVQHHGGEQ